MKSRETMLGAMSDGLESGFPVVIPYPGIFFRDHWEEITDQPWWVAHGSDLSSSLRAQENLQRKLDLDWVTCRALHCYGICPSKEWRESHRIETEGSRVFLVDTLSGKKEEIHRQPPGGAQNSIDREPLIKSMDDVDKYIDVIDKETLIRSGRLDSAIMAVKRFGSEKFVLAGGGSPYCLALGSYFGFKTMMINLFKKPKLVEYTIERILARIVEEIRAYTEVGVDGFWLEETFSSADEISPEYFRRFVLSYNKELISEMRRLGLKSIYYPCGDIRDRLQLIVESNSDCIAFEESKKGFEIGISWVNDVVAGRACIFGNLDAIKVLQNGTSIELRREIRRQINIGRKYGKFVMSLGSPVTPATPVSRVREYVDIARQESEKPS